MRINDELLDKLGTYFVYHELHEKEGITFESFVGRWQNGTWRGKFEHYTK